MDDYFFKLAISVFIPIPSTPAFSLTPYEYYNLLTQDAYEYITELRHTIIEEYRNFTEVLHKEMTKADRELFFHSDYISFDDFAFATYLISSRAFRGKGIAEEKKVVYLYGLLDLFNERDLLSKNASDYTILSERKKNAFIMTKYRLSPGGELYYTYFPNLIHTFFINFGFVPDIDYMIQNECFPMKNISEFDNAPDFLRSNRNYGKFQ